MIGKSLRKSGFTAIALVTLILAAGATGLAIRACHDARGAFRRLVMCPVPPSVEDVKMDRCRASSSGQHLDGIQEDAVVLRFDISKDDVARIVAARGFKPLTYKMWCYEGTVTYEEPEARIGGSFALYTPEHHAPRWFDLDHENWADFDAYWLGDQDKARGAADMSFLFYKEQFGRAYLVRWVESPT